MINFIDRDGIVHIDFAATARRAKRNSESGLRFVIRDAQQTIDAFPDSPKAGYYADEISIYAGELKYRQLVSR